MRRTTRTLFYEEKSSLLNTRSRKLNVFISVIFPRTVTTVIVCTVYKYIMSYPAFSGLLNTVSTSTVWSASSGYLGLWWPVSIFNYAQLWRVNTRIEEIRIKNNVLQFWGRDLGLSKDYYKTLEGKQITSTTEL